MIGVAYSAATRCRRCETVDGLRRGSRVDVEPAGGAPGELRPCVDARRADVLAGVQSGTPSPTRTPFAAVSAMRPRSLAGRAAQRLDDLGQGVFRPPANPGARPGPGRVLDLRPRRRPVRPSSGLGQSRGSWWPMAPSAARCATDDRRRGEAERRSAASTLRQSRPDRRGQLIGQGRPRDGHRGTPRRGARVRPEPAAVRTRFDNRRSRRRRQRANAADPCRLDHGGDARQRRPELRGRGSAPRRRRARRRPRASRPSSCRATDAPVRLRRGWRVVPVQTVAG